MQITPKWEYVADTVMGGVSTGQIESAIYNARRATRLTGQVSLENNGGFVQMAFDLHPDGRVLDASAYTGIEIDLRGNGETYDLRLRTDALSRSWQSYRADFTAQRDWHSLQLPFAGFVPHRTEIPFDPARLRRVGVLAIGRVFEADVMVSGLRFYMQA